MEAIVGDILTRRFTEILLLFAFISVAVIAAGVRFPATFCGTMLFQLSYNTLGPERALPLYQWSLSLGVQNELPPDTDRYLVRQLLDSGLATAEKDAIFDFYLSRTESGPSQYLLAHKREMSRQLSSRIDSYSPVKRLSALILLNNLENGRQLSNKEIGRLLNKSLPGTTRHQVADFQKDGTF